MSENLLAKYAGNVPRYTSYPTAPHFHAGIDNGVYRSWLGMLSQGDTLSLYLHIPFCDRLCWFCACHTKQTLKYDPVRAYVAVLVKEIAAVGAVVDKAARVTAIHFGGGSPTLLAPDDMVAIMEAIRAGFTVDASADISVEMDPNDLDQARYDALARIGMTRASLGVQDFNPAVQESINRIQSFEHTKGVVDEVRARGVQSVNVDIVYGLPRQTMESMEATVDQILSLKPDRIALFGYAHVPWMKKHQTMIDEATLPGPDERFMMMTRAGAMIEAAGYVAIGIDHFALPGDSLALAQGDGTMNRNFQGYTDDAATALIGFGASSIGKLPQGYVQNQAATGVYQSTVEKEGLAAMRGIALSDDDRLRAWVIERIMCDFAFDFEATRARFGSAAEPVIQEAKAWAAGNSDRLVEIRDGVFRLTRRGKPFARTIAAVFDAYFARGTGRHSIAV